MSSGSAKTTVEIRGASVVERLLEFAVLARDAPAGAEHLLPIAADAMLSELSTEIGASSAAAGALEAATASELQILRLELERAKSTLRRLGFDPESLLHLEDFCR